MNFILILATDITFKLDEFKRKVPSVTMDRGKDVEGPLEQITEPSTMKPYLEVSIELLNSLVVSTGINLFLDTIIA